MSLFPSPLKSPTATPSDRNSGSSSMRVQPWSVSASKNGM